MKVCANTQTWTKVCFNLLPYKGQTIRIYFNTHMGNGLLTYMNLDDVKVSLNLGGKARYQPAGATWPWAGAPRSR